MRAAHSEGKQWKEELYKYLLANRSTPHTTTGVSPAELLFRCIIRAKLPDLSIPGVVNRENEIISEIRTMRK